MLGWAQWIRFVLSRCRNRVPISRLSNSTVLHWMVVDNRSIKCEYTFYVIVLRLRRLYAPPEIFLRAGDVAGAKGIPPDSFI